MQWMTNHEKNKQVLSALSVFVRLKGKGNNKKKKKAEKRTDEKEAIKVMIQFGCLLLVCPLLCFFLLFVVICRSSLT